MTVSASACVSLETNEPDVGETVLFSQDPISVDDLITEWVPPDSPCVEQGRSEAAVVVGRVKNPSREPAELFRQKTTLEDSLGVVGVLGNGTDTVGIIAVRAPHTDVAHAPRVPVERVLKTEEQANSEPSRKARRREAKRRKVGRQP